MTKLGLGIQEFSELKRNNRFTAKKREKDGFMKNVGLGKQELSIFQEENLIYVDKTEVIYNLIQSGSYYFLSRPRRFGKSLLVNTIKELFEGNQELFEDCWIYDQWNWEEKTPVIKISFSEIRYRTLGLEKALNEYLLNLASEHQIELVSMDYSGKFLELIKKLGAEKRAVILIDEYDKPIIDYLEEEELDQAIKNRKILKSFYTGVKDQDKYIRFFFITGVSKFSRVSIFSDLNHLTDITINDDCATIVGYSEEEIKKYYAHYLELLANKFQISQEQLLDQIRTWYNGYSWDGERFMYNPYSVLSLFYSKRFKNYWFATGTPTFLIKQFKESEKSINSYINKLVDEDIFDSYDIEDLNLTAIMFQTGYLTIKQIDDKNNQYTLDFPNKEVRESFVKFSVKHYVNSSFDEMGPIVEALLEALNNKDMDAFLLSFRSLFSSITSKQLTHVQTYEGFYHSIIFIVLKMMGISIQCEVQSNHGATDAVVKTDQNIFVLEFKNIAQGGAQAGLAQIHKKKYYEPYLADQREVMIAGISFDPGEKNLVEVLSEVVKK